MCTINNTIEENEIETGLYFSSFDCYYYFLSTFIIYLAFFIIERNRVLILTLATKNENKNYV